MNATAWIALAAVILAATKAGIDIREHLIKYPIRKPKPEEEDPEGD